MSLACASCSTHPDRSPAGKDGWLTGDDHSKLDTVAKHLRGFDMAMVETGYRYNELYFALHDSNWGYATYQLQKIRTAVENGLERRPKRAASAQPFLETGLPQLEAAIDAQDRNLCQERFEVLRAFCNSCHAAERVEFIPVVVPAHRFSPIEFRTDSDVSRSD
jgi:hypothetical protein